MKQARTLRIIQIAFIVYTIFLFWIIRIIPANSPHISLTPFDWAVVVIALIDAAISFIIPNILARAGNRPGAAAMSPIQQWMGRKIVRMAFSLSVSLFGLVLHTTGCPDRVVKSLMALGLILLLFCGPGDVPDPSSTHGSSAT
jgi:hypothetical protein